MGVNRDATAVNDASVGYDLQAAQPAVPIGCKQTEVGVIPEDWGVSTLGDCLVVRPSYGINAPAVPYSDSLPVYVRITDINDDGQFVPDPPVSVHSDSSENYYLSDGDIVFARTGASVGKSYRYKLTDGPLVFAGFLIRVRADEQRLLPDFLAAYVTTGRYWQWVRLMSMRSGQPGINGNEYAQLPVPLPPIPEQRAIATALSDVDALLEGLDRLIAKKRDLKKASMQQLLTGQTRLPGFDGEWTYCDLPKVLLQGDGIKIGPFGSQLKKDYLVQSGLYRVYGQENVYRNSFSFGSRYLTQERFEKLKSCEIKPGDFVVSSMGTIGKCAIVPPNICVGIMDSHLIRLRIDRSKLISQYLLHLFSSDFQYLDNQTRRLSVGGIMDGLSTKIIRALEIEYPESLEEQAAIVSLLSDMDAELEALEQRRVKTAALKQAMKQELLAGRTRLI